MTLGILHKAQLSLAITDLFEWQSPVLFLAEIR